MKKRLTAAITSALVIGVASTTFAAANPFSDVPTDHWSFDAVAKLAQDGVIEGYGDNTFRGDTRITRYEMAQMVAKAMAKSEDLSMEAKATVDKLAAEYSEELNNLGVRVSNLEKKTDNLKFTGEVRMRYDRVNDGSDYTRALFRLNGVAKVNDDWSVKARFNSEVDVDNTNESTKNKTTTEVDRVYAEGPLFGATAKLGKIPVYTAQGYVIDDPINGAEFTWKKNRLTTTLIAGSMADDLVGGNLIDGRRVVGNSLYARGGSASYQSLDFTYAATDKTNIGLAYHRISGEDKGFITGDSKNNIWTFAFDTKLSQDFLLKGIYAKTGLDKDKKNGYSVELGYKGAQASVPGSFGLSLAYRSVPLGTAVSSTWDGAKTGYKGYEIGANYTLSQNIVAKAWYFDGKDVDFGRDSKMKHFRGQVQFFF